MKVGDKSKALGRRVWGYKARV